MSLIRVAFLGTPDIARHCLQSLIDDEHFLVVGVVTQPDKPAGRKMKMQSSPVKELAEQEGLPCITPKSVNTAEALETIRSWKAEAAVIVAYGQIIREDLLNLFQRQIVNVHASLLPKWRGAAPIQRSIEAGEEQTGVSLQIVTPGLDAGDIIGEKKIKIDPEEGSLELLERMKPLAAELLEVEFMDYLRGNLAPTPQDEKQVTLAPKISKEEAKINWQSSAQSIKNKMRAFTMGPGVYALLEGKKIKFHKLQVVEAKSSAQLGEVIEVTKESFCIQTGEGALKVLVLQPESKGKMAAKDFLVGRPLKVGDCFE